MSPFRSAGAQQRRFAASLDGLTQAAEHADRVAPLKSYCTGVLILGERKSVEPMAAQLAPDSRWGTVGIAAGWAVINSFVQLPLFSRIFRRINSLRSEYLGALWPALSGCAVMAISIDVLKFVSSELWPRLALEILIGIVPYGMVLLLLHRNYLRGFCSL
jgi:hypothetical protein